MNQFSSWFRNNSWLAPTMVAVVSVAYLPLVFWPQKRAVADLRQAIRAKQQLIAQGEKLPTLLRLADVDLTESREYLQQANAIYLGEGELATVQAQINRAIQAAGGTINKFDPRPAAELETLRKETFVIGFLGSSDTLRESLHAIEGLPARVWIQEIKVDAPAENGKPVTCELTLVVFVDKSSKSG